AGRDARNVRTVPTPADRGIAVYASIHFGHLPMAVWADARRARIRGEARRIACLGDEPGLPKKRMCLLDSTIDDWNRTTRPYDTVGPRGRRAYFGRRLV